MGSGTLTDDFISDKTLAKLISSFAKRKRAIDLVLNGDTFDFLKCPAKDGTYPLYVTEGISLDKMRRIARAHPEVFTALKTFVRAKNKHVYFIFGNHDMDLAFPKVQKYLTQVLKTDRVHFRISYNFGEIHIEHGQQHDHLNKTEELFFGDGKKRILNFSYSSRGVLDSFMHVKEQNPFLERIHSRKKMFKFHPPILRTLQWCAVKQMIRQMYYELIQDPFRKAPPGIIKELWRKWWRDDWELPDIVEILRKHCTSSFCVLGHLHHCRVEKGKKIIATPDTWRDEYILDDQKKLTPKKKYYVQIFTRNNAIKNWRLVHVPIKRSIFDFEKMVKDQFKYLKIAAGEEKGSFQVKA